MNRISKSFLATALALSSGSLVAADSYEVIELGTLGIYPTAAFAINNNGQIVGYSSKAAVDNENNFFSRAFSYQEPQMNDLGAFEYLVEVTDGNKCEVVSSTRQDFSLAFSNNNSDNAVGYSRREVDRVRDGELVTLCTCEDADGNEVNITCTDTLERGVIFDQATGDLIELPEMVAGETHNMVASNINDAGIVIGYGNFESTDADGDAILTRRPYFYDSNSQDMTVISPVSDDTTAEAILLDINSADIAVGWSHVKKDDSTLLLAAVTDSANPGNLIQIPLFSEVSSQANAINDSGLIVGTSVDSESRYRTSFIHNLNDGQTTDIGVLAPDIVDGAIQVGLVSLSQAYDVNNNGQVVGTSFVDFIPSPRSTVNHAYIYENGELKDLNNLIDCKQDGSTPTAPADWVLIEARSINDSGWIVGNGINNGEQKAFLLKPRDGVEPQACEPFFEDDDSGDGSLPIFGFAFLAALIGFRRKY